MKDLAKTKKYITAQIKKRKYIIDQVKKRKYIIIFLIFMVASGVLIAYHMTPPKIQKPPTTSVLYVSGNGTGDFRCDGKDDQVQINQALKYAAENPQIKSVYLKGPFTYTISDTLYIGSNITLEGDPTAAIKLVDNANWPRYKPMIQQINSSGNHDITIRGFEINGNYDGNTNRLRGSGYYTLIYLTNSYNIAVYNMYMHDSNSDGLKVENMDYGIKTPTNIKFYNNRVYKLGHDALYCIRTTDVEAYNNTITCRTNSALRVVNTNHVKLHDNRIDSDTGSGGPGIEIQKKDSTLMDDIEIYNNLIYGTYGSGIWMFGYGNYEKETGKNVHIHHNIFYNTATNPKITEVGGIVIQGFNNTLIENNVIDGSYNDGIAYANYYENTPGSGYVTIVRNNIIVNTKPHPKNPRYSGYGVNNYQPEANTFVLENNCLYNNSRGDYRHASSKTDIHADPLFANPKNHDYNLKSRNGRWNGKTWVNDTADSPCIDAGYPGSKYSLEPAENGGRINIGRYGNTKYASKSKTSSNLPPSKPIT